MVNMFTVALWQSAGFWPTVSDPVSAVLSWVKEDPTLDAPCVDDPVLRVAQHPPTSCPFLATRSSTPSIADTFGMKSAQHLTQHE